MKRLLVLLIILTYCFLLLTSPAGAAGEFLSNYNVVYYVQTDGTTKVDQQITLTNQLTNLYPTESEIILGSPNIYSISAYDNIGKIFIKVGKENDNTRIRAIFNEKVVGKGKSYIWHLTYETPDLVSINGLVKEVNIPKLELNPDIKDYNLTIRVPESFGEILYVKPDNKRILFFDKNDLSRSQISVAFGSFQVFNFRLNYMLKNTGITPSYSEIALPPDTNYQKIILKTLSPAPDNVTIDPDGNWMAGYRLAPEQKLSIVATGSAQIFFKSQSPQYLTSFNELKTLTSPQKYWDTTDNTIKMIAGQLKTIEDIYNYTVKTLKYDYRRVEGTPRRLGAKYILQNPESAICMEFTDLFISLARAKGYAVREIDGYAFTTNSKLKPLSLKKDVLHAWPEYYDREKKMWIQVDPTWGNTSGVDFFKIFDLNHFTFVRRGRNSEYPYPAGAYKDNGAQTRDVEINFGNLSDLENKNRADLNWQLPKQLYAGFSYEGILTVKNKGYTALNKSNITIKADNAEILSDTVFETETIPPFGRKEYKVTFKPVISSRKGLLTAFYGSTSVSAGLLVKPLTIIYLVPVFFLVIILALISLFLYQRLWKQ